MSAMNATQQQQIQQHGKRLAEMVGPAVAATELDWGVALSLADAINAAPACAPYPLAEVRKRMNASKQPQLQARACELLDVLVKNSRACATVIAADPEFRKSISALLLSTGKAAAATRVARELLLRSVAQWSEAAAKDLAMRPFAVLHSELISKGVEFPSTGPNPLLAVSPLPPPPPPPPGLVAVHQEVPRVVDFRLVAQDVAMMDAVVAMGVPNMQLAQQLAAKLHAWNECIARSLADESVLANEGLLSRMLDANSSVLRVISSYQTAIARPRQQTPPPPPDAPPSYAAVSADRQSFTVPAISTTAEPPLPVRYELGARFAPIKLVFDNTTTVGQQAPPQPPPLQLHRPSSFGLEQSYQELYGPQPP